MKISTFALLSDGGSDKALLPALHFLLRQAFPEQGHWQGTAVEIERSGLRRKRLAERIRWSVSNYPCVLIFIHRDAEGEPAESRLSEIYSAVADARLAEHGVPVVPVRMTEAWLLLDEAAIRRAAGVPKGTRPLSMPPLERLESLPDPKAKLRELLEAAGGKTGRALKRLRSEFGSQRHLVADYTKDWTPLLGLSAARAVTDRLRSIRL